VKGREETKQVSAGRWQRQAKEKVLFVEATQFPAEKSVV
jgi:hypothetical protein